MEPNSLWASVLKARYYPNSTFLEAKRGGRASWIWSSLLVGREILLEGAHWQIMSGNETRVWVDRWLPSTPLGRPTPLGTVSMSKNLKVKSLICQEDGEWEIDFLKPFMSGTDYEAILGLHSGDPLLRDRLVWPFVKEGSYSVKSGYFWSLNHNLGRIYATGTLTNCPRALWKIIWKLEVPPKIRNFMWRTMHGAIATMKNLFQRRSSPSPLCPICKSCDESIVHMFLKCPWVSGLWVGGLFSINSHQLQDFNWTDWLLRMFDSALGSKKIRLMILSHIAFTCWHIWISRCEFLFNNLPINTRRIAAAISLSTSAFKDSNPAPGNSSLQCHGRVEEVIHWSAPNPGAIKINVDVSWDASKGTGFVGVVARNEEGRFLAACRYRIKAKGVAMAEALAILYGCKLGASSG